MAVPKKKTSQSKKGMRRSHDFIKPANVQICENCGKQIIPHHVCKYCSHYKGKNISVVESLDKQ